MYFSGWLNLWRVWEKELIGLIVFSKYDRKLLYSYISLPALLAPSSYPSERDLQRAPWLRYQPDISHLPIVRRCRVCSISSLLGSGLEVSFDKGRNIVLISDGGGLLATKTALVDDILEEAVLLGSDLLEDLGKQIFHLLDIGGSDDGEEVLTVGEVN